MFKRVFWFSNNMLGSRSDLDAALASGQRVSHFGVTDAGVLVITDGAFASKQNAEDQLVAEETKPQQ